MVARSIDENGAPIIYRNGQWVYEANGKPAVSLLKRIYRKIFG